VFVAYSLEFLVIDSRMDMLKEKPILNEEEAEELKNLTKRTDLLGGYLGMQSPSTLFEENPDEIYTPPKVMWSVEEIKDLIDKGDIEGARAVFERDTKLMKRRISSIEKEINAKKEKQIALLPLTRAGDREAIKKYNKLIFEVNELYKEHRGIEEVYDYEKRMVGAESAEVVIPLEERKPYRPPEEVESELEVGSEFRAGKIELKLEPPKQGVIERIGALFAFLTFDIPELPSLIRTFVSLSIAVPVAFVIWTDVIGKLPTGAKYLVVGGLSVSALVGYLASLII